MLKFIWKKKTKSTGTSPSPTPFENTQTILPKKTDSEYRDGKMPKQRPKRNKRVHRATLWAKTFVHLGLMIENQSLS